MLAECRRMKGVLIRALATVAPPLVFLLLVLVAWDRLVVWGDIPAFRLPRPLAVLEAGWQRRAALGSATWNTAVSALGGFGLSLAVGTLLALVFSQFPLVRRAVYPYAIFFQTVPIVAVAPLVIRWVSYEPLKVMIVAHFISVFPIITNVTAGMTRIDANQRELFAIHNATWRQMLFKLRLPNAVPYLVIGARISCGLAVIGAIVGDIYAGSGASADAYALGYFIHQTGGQLKTAEQFAGVLCSTFLGLAIFGAVSLSGTTVLWRWHGAHAREQ